MSVDNIGCLKYRSNKQILVHFKFFIHYNNIFKKECDILKMLCQQKSVLCEQRTIKQTPQTVKCAMMRYLFIISNMGIRSSI